MEHPRVKQLLDDLQAWVNRDPEYGRKSELARLLGVRPSVIGDWLSRRSTPNAHHAFHILDFLEAEKRKPTRKRKDGPAPAP
jgi:transcriptional regulator with XRE-family HTH domain